MSSVTVDTSIHAPSINPFAKALIRASLEPQFFFLSQKEKIVLASTALVSALLTLGVWFSTTLPSDQQLVSLSPRVAIQQLPAHTGNDEASLASYFLTQATQALSGSDSNATQVAGLLATQAKQQLALLPTNDPARTSLEPQLAMVESKVSQIAVNTPAVKTLQQIGTAASAPLEISSVQTLTTSNTHQGEVTLTTGKSSLFISYPKLSDASQLYLKPEDANNEVLYVQSRETGKGFTVASTVPVSHDIHLTWYEISQ